MANEPPKVKIKSQSKLMDGRGKNGDLEMKDKAVSLIDKEVLLPDMIFEGGAPPKLKRVAYFITLPPPNPPSGKSLNSLTAISTLQLTGTCGPSTRMRRRRRRRAGIR